MNDLEVRHRTITDSLNYASRIQQAMLPSEKYFKKYFDKSFILHMPKDILSGDFYWIEKRDDKIFVAAGDCTGHGVPGALMSMMGHDMLEKAINVDRMVHPSHILDAMNEWIGKTFNCEKNNNSEIHDGIDLGLCVVDLKRQYVEFAGALSRLYIIRNNSIHEIKGDRFSLGSLPPWASYRNASFDLLPDDTIYLFSDGYPDQFGGSDARGSLRRNVEPQHRQSPLFRTHPPHPVRFDTRRDLVGCGIHGTQARFEFPLAQPSDQEVLERPNELGFPVQTQRPRPR